MNAKLSKPLAFAVGYRHRPGSSPWACPVSIHMANNLCKDLSVGYLKLGKAAYDAGVLTYLDLSSSDIAELRASLAKDIRDEVKRLMSLCLGSYTTLRTRSTCLCSRALV